MKGPKWLGKQLINIKQIPIISSVVQIQWILQENSSDILCRYPLSHVNISMKAQRPIVAKQSLAEREVQEASQWLTSNCTTEPW